VPENNNSQPTTNYRHMNKLNQKSLDQTLNVICEARSDREILTAMSSAFGHWIINAQDGVCDDPREAVEIFIQDSIDALALLVSKGLDLENKEDRARVQEEANRTKLYWRAAASVVDLYWSSDGRDIHPWDLEESLEPLHEKGAELIGEEAWVTSAALILTDFVFNAANRFADGGKLTIAGNEYPSGGPQ
jgi:hypothetical protein